MYNVKVNLNIIIPGRVMLSEQECSRKIRKPLLYTKGKRKGEQIKDKNGNAVWYTAIEADPSKSDHFTLEVTNENNEKEILSIYTRKCKSAKQSINISEEAYQRMISTEMPDNFRPAREFLPKEVQEGAQHTNKSSRVTAWNAMTVKERLEWHLKDFAKSLGGVMDTYIVFED